MIESLIIDSRIKVREPKDLLTPFRVVRVNKFDEESVKFLSTSVSTAHQTGQTVIPIVIDSYGGDVYSLFAMVDILRSSKLTIATIVEGKAFSCGAVLFTCGSKGFRFMGPNATFMIHDISDYQPRKKAEEIKSDAKETDRVNKRFYSVIDENLQKPIGWHWNQIREKGRIDWYLNAKTALKLGYADHIRIPVVQTKISVDTQFDLK